VSASNSPFQFDDRGAILRELSVHSLSASLTALAHSLRALLKLSYAVSWARGGGAMPGGVVAGVWFALHPIQTEAVTYVTGRALLGLALGWALLRARVSAVRAAAAAGAHAVATR